MPIRVLVCALVLLLASAWSVVAQVDLQNLELTTPIERPPITTLRVKSVLVDFQNAALHFTYTYGNFVDGKFFEALGTGSIMFQKPEEVTDIFTLFTESISPLIKALISGKLSEVPIRE